MLFKLSNLNSNLTLTLGYLNSALNNWALGGKITITLPPPPQKKILLKSSHSKTYILGKLNFPTLKKSQSGKIQTAKKSFDHSYQCKSPVTPELHKRSCEMYLLTTGIKIKGLNGQNID